jgi:hypothetical protein
MYVKYDGSIYFSTSTFNTKKQTCIDSLKVIPVKEQNFLFPCLVLKALSNFECN